MKVVILAGGFGTRLSEETDTRPKPMAEIGGKPILWHIMKIYSSYGFNDFVVLLGYKGYHIKEYFANYFLHQSNVTIDLSNNALQIHESATEPWKVTLVETGLHTMTGGRIAQAKPYIQNQRFLLTYGDGVANVNIKTLIDFHEIQGKHITMTAVQPDGRFGALEISEDNLVHSFTEKPKGDGNWINGGFFVCEPTIFDYIPNNPMVVFEKEPLECLAKENNLSAYKFDGFWKCMDTLRDKTELNQLWESNKAQWKIW